MFYRLQRLLKGLIDLIYRKYCIFFGVYPVSIIPTSTNKIIDINKLKEVENIVVLRRSFLSNEDTFDISGKPKQRALVEVSNGNAKVEGLIKGYSMNLLGGAFVPENSKFVQITHNGIKGSAEWNEKEQIYFWDYRRCFRIEEEKANIFFKLSDIHNKRIPYFSKSKDYEKSIATFYGKKIEDIRKEKSGKFLGSTKIIHKPTVLNFWHIQLHALDERNELVKGSKVKAYSPDKPLKEQGYKTQVGYHILAEILETNAKKDLAPSKIPIKIYCYV